MHKFRSPIFSIASVAAAAVLAISISSPARAVDADADDAGYAKPVDSPQARQILTGMANFLASQKAFRVDIDCAHDAVQPTGQKIEFIDRRQITVRRPNEMRMDVQRSDGQSTAVYINPATITAMDVNKKVYAQTEAKASLDDNLKFLLRDLRMQLPMALLLSSQLPAALQKRVVQVDYVEQTTLLGKPVHHIAGSTNSIDFQMWIGADKQPLPYRIVLTYRNAEGEPQFRGQFSNWELSPWIRSATFSPAVGNAHRIAFLPQIKAAAAAQGAPAQSASASKGAAK